MSWLVRVLGGVLGWLAGSVLRIRRLHVEASMAAAGIEDPRAKAGEMYRALGMSAVEFLWLAARGRRALAGVRIDPASRQRWQEALSRGRGVVVAGSHTGNWDWGACAIAGETPLLVVTKQLRVGWIDRFWQATRAAQGVRLAEAAGAMKRGREVLRGGGAVAMMIDQVPEFAGRGASRAVVVPFLGRPVLVDRAPATLAAATRAPLVVAVGCREGPGRHVLHVLDVLQPPVGPGESRRAWVDEATRRATLALEGFVRANPSQWLWLHRRWKRLDRPSGGAMLAAPCPSTTPSSSPDARSTAV